MPIPKKITNYLDKQNLKYNVLEHRKVYTGLDKARTLKTKENVVGKTVVLKLDKFYLIALLAVNRSIDLEKIIKKSEIVFNKKIKKASFAQEKWIKENLKGMKEGAIPPFGDVWKLRTFIDKSFLDKNKKIILNSGDHRNSIETTPNSFKKIIEDPVIFIFSKARVKLKKKIKKKK